MTDLKKLQKLNKMKISHITDKGFKTYGKIIEGYDFSEMILFLEENCQTLQENIYIPSEQRIEKTIVFEEIEKSFYGEMKAQAGYCCGKNSTLNGFEYHKGSEINVAASDFVLILGHSWDISNENTYKVSDAEAFFVPKGTAIELYQTTLHLSPCKVTDDGFKTIVILPKGTNTQLEEEKKSFDTRDKLLLMKNKWVLAHSQGYRLIQKGAVEGLIGDNYKVEYK